ncbi:MAG TPA: flagellar brake protein [Limnobacter sp.]|nr:flagellar brake protein [Limnobacter sp.]
MDNPKELSPLAKGEIELGKPLPFSIYDSQGVLLLAAGQTIANAKQLDDLSGKGLYHNPRWATASALSKLPQGLVKPEAQFRTSVTKTAAHDEPSETGYSIKMSLPGSPEHFHVKLIGAHGRDALVVTHPLRDGQFVFVKEGQVWEFRSFYGMSVYRFSAMIEKVLLSPYPMLVISWPQEQQLETKLIRSSRRVACDLPATLKIGDQLTYGLISNLSTGGVEFRTSASTGFVLNQSIQIAFQLNLLDHKYVLELPAKLMSLTDSSGEKVLGLSFSALDDHHFAILHAFVCDRLIQKLAPPLYSKG